MVNKSVKSYNPYFPGTHATHTIQQILIMVTTEQITSLLDFLEDKPELAIGRLNKTTEGRQKTKRLWTECANILNGISADNVKTVDAWRSYFNDYKFKTLKKIRLHKEELSATGGGKRKKLDLTDNQERLYTILGRDVGEPLKCVQQNPLDEAEISANEEIVIEISDHDFYTSENTQQEHPQDPFEEVCTSAQAVQDNSHGCPQEDAAPPRHRRRRSRSSNTTTSQNHTPLWQQQAIGRTLLESRLQVVEQRLQNLEANGAVTAAILTQAKAIDEHSRSINRLADAIQLIAKTLVRPNDLV